MAGNYEDIAEFLHSIGWKSPNDAQWTRLRDALPELTALLPTDAALTAANERIRELGAENKSLEEHIHTIGIMYAKQGDRLTAEREVSDKLEKALAEAIDEIEGMSGHDMSCDPNIYCDDFRALLEEVAAIRKGE